jgi:hypothetical protein
MACGVEGIDADDGMVVGVIIDRHNRLAHAQRNRKWGEAVFGWHDYSSYWREFVVGLFLALSVEQEQPQDQ